MKVAFVYPFPLAIGANRPRLPGNFGVGGGEVYSFRVAMELARMGHDVTFFTGMFPGIRKNPLRIGRLKIEYLDIKIWKGFTQYAVMPALMHKLLLGKFDVVHSWQFPTAYTFVSGVAAKATGARFVVSHVGITPGTSRGTKVFARMNRSLPDKIVALTDFGKSYYRGYVDMKRMEVIYPGINTELFYPERSKSLERRFRDEKVILYTGRLIPSKGVDYLIRAFAVVNKKHPKSRLVIIGQGHIKGDLEKLARELGVEKKVDFEGYVKDGDLRKYYTRCDVFVLPPVYKDSWGGRNLEPGGFGLVLAEAMVCGAPTVSTRVDTIPHWIKDGRNGLLCPPNDAACLANRIMRYFGDRKLRDRIVKKSKSIVLEKYTMDSVARQFEKVYRGR